MRTIAFCFLLLLAGCNLPRGFIPVTSTRTAAAPTLPTPAPTPHAPELHAIAASLTPEACTVANTNGEVLNIRKRPAMDAPIIGGLLPGQRLEVIAWGTSWHQVRTGELTGFVFSKYCMKGR